MKTRGKQHHEKLDRYIDMDIDLYIYIYIDTDDGIKQK